MARNGGRGQPVVIGKRSAPLTPVRARALPAWADPEGGRSWGRPDLWRRCCPVTARHKGRLCRCETRAWSRRAGQCHWPCRRQGWGWTAACAGPARVGAGNGHNAHAGGHEDSGGGVAGRSGGPCRKFVSGGWGVRNSAAPFRCALKAPRLRRRDTGRPIARHHRPPVITMFARPLAVLVVAAMWVAVDQGAMSVSHGSPVMKVQGLDPIGREIGIAEVGVAGIGREGLKSVSRVRAEQGNGRARVRGMKAGTVIRRRVGRGEAAIAEATINGAVGPHAPIVEPGCRVKSLRHNRRPSVVIRIDGTGRQNGPRQSQCQTSGDRV